MLKIKSLCIHMFRFYKHNEFSFVTENGVIAPFVLISGGNGKGKTSIMDAIEWCFTGDVHHLNAPYKMRIKGDPLKGHSFCLIRNKDCNKSDETWVELTIEEDGTESILRRSTKENELDPDKTSLKIIQIDKVLDSIAAREWLAERFGSGNRPFADFFYKYFICDLQKAEDFRSKSRKEMTEEFDDFTLEHSEAKQVLGNLEQLQAQLDSQIKELQGKKTTEEQLVKLELEQQGLKEAAHIPVYVQRTSYPDERLDVDRLSTAEQEEQLQLLIAGGFNAATDMLNKLVQSRRRLIIKTLYESHKEDIQQAIRKKLYDPNTIRTLEEQRRKISEKLQGLNDQTLEQTGKFALDYRLVDLTPTEWQTRWQEYCKLNELWRNTEATYNDCKKGDELLIAFSRLVGVRGQIDEYRKVNKKCPLCGSEEAFGSEPIEQLAIEAEKYVQAHDAQKLTLEQQVKVERQLWINYRIDLIKYLENTLNAAQERLNIELELDKKVAETTETFFRLISTLNLTPEHFSGLVTLAVFDGFGDVDAGTIRMREQEILSLLTFLGYSDCEQISTAPETVREAIRPLAKKTPAMFIFDELDVRGKIVSLRLSKGNRHLAEITRDIEEKRIRNVELEKLVQEKVELQGLVKERSSKIRGKLNQMKNDEVKGVAPYLFHIFSKLVKHSTLSGFHLQGNDAKATDTKLTFTDENGNPILNIISDGQLGAFMLSYLLGNAFRRKDTGSFHCYFVDDVTNSMDDINLISFIDIIKYQLSESSKKVNGLQQFFFSTCDGNLKRMFQYKMDGFEVPVALIDLDMK